MRDIPPELIIESVDAGVGTFIDLFEVDLRPYGGDVVRFHSGTNGFYNNVIWRGNAYPAYPIAVEGFESRNEGTYARPAMAVANVTGMIFGMNHDFDDLLGVVITRRQVPVKYLDAVNFPNGNPDAVKWFTEFGHLNRGDMLTSEHYRCLNEKKKFQCRV